MHLTLEDHVLACLHCHPVLDPGLEDPYYVSLVGDVVADCYLVEEIEKAALQSNLNPKTGEPLGLDDIIERHVEKGRREQSKHKVINSYGNESSVPFLNILIPPMLIRQTWCDWADGWTITLINGAAFREQPGPEASGVSNGEGYGRFKPGWHVFDKDDTKILSIPSNCTGYPDALTLADAWRTYLLVLDAEGTCTRCLGLGTQYVGYKKVQYPCHSCDPDPCVEEGFIYVPLGITRVGAQAKWWRYQGKDMVWVTNINVKKREGEGIGWAMLCEPPPDERPREQDQVWDDDIGDWAPISVLDTTPLEQLAHPRMDRWAWGVGGLCIAILSVSVGVTTSTWWGLALAIIGGLVPGIVVVIYLCNRFFQSWS